MKKLILLFISLLALGAFFQACDDTKTYAEMLEEERDGVNDFIKKNNIEVYELAGVEPNPRHTTVNKGAKICKENNITAVLGIGGGSTIDASKAIAALTLADTDNIWDLVEKK